MENPTATPYRQIRACSNNETITVYQAYSTSIATAAVSAQKLSASPHFAYNRMTWIKPSFCWMMYRSGYALKDPRQTNILALKIKHENFRKVLMEAAVCRGGKEGALTEEEKARGVRVQWDPERGPDLGVLGYRSIQIGIGRGLSRVFVEEYVESIEDVTEMAVKLREEIERSKKDGEKVDVESLIEKGCLPREQVYDGLLDEEVKAVLRMDRVAEE